MWTCSKCKESIEDQFDACWKCAGEAQPESAQPSEAETHYERDIDVIVAGVRKIRRRRNTVWILFALFLPVLLLTGRLFVRRSSVFYLSVHGALRGGRSAAGCCPVPSLW